MAKVPPSSGTVRWLRRRTRNSSQQNSTEMSGQAGQPQFSLRSPSSCSKPTGTTLTWRRGGYHHREPIPRSWRTDLPPDGGQSSDRDTSLLQQDRYPSGSATARPSPSSTHESRTIPSEGVVGEGDSPRTATELGTRGETVEEGFAFARPQYVNELRRANARYGYVLQQDLSTAIKELSKPFSPSHDTLVNGGLHICRNQDPNISDYALIPAIAPPGSHYFIESTKDPAKFRLHIPATYKEMKRGEYESIEGDTSVD